MIEVQLKDHLQIVGIPNMTTANTVDKMATTFLEIPHTWYITTWYIMCLVDNLC